MQRIAHLALVLLALLSLTAAPLLCAHTLAASADPGCMQMPMQHTMPHVPHLPSCCTLHHQAAAAVPSIAPPPAPQDVATTPQFQSLLQDTALTRPALSVTPAGAPPGLAPLPLRI